MRPFVLIFLPLALLAQDPDDAARQNASEAAVAPGKMQFQQTCGFCHGPDGRGASGPDLIRSPLVNRDVNGNLIGSVVRSGRPEKGMPAFQLSDVEIKNIAAFLHAEAKIAASVARNIPRDYPLEKLLVGHAEAGKAYFNGGGKCSTCHSVSGDLAHIATKYKPFDLQTRIAFPSGAKPQLQVREASGRTFSGDEIYSDEFFVSLRDKQGWLHTWKRSAVEVTVQDPLAEHTRLLESYTDQNIHDLFAYLESLK